MFYKCFHITMKDIYKKQEYKEWHEGNMTFCHTRALNYHLPNKYFKKINSVFLVSISKSFPYIFKNKSFFH